MSGLVAIAPAGPKDTTEYGENSERERTDCEHEKEPFTQHGSCPCRGLTSIGIARKFWRIGRTSKVTFRNGFYAGIVVAVLWSIYLFQLWQPQRQIELHNVHLLEQIEKRNWKNVGEFVGETYQDRWGNDRRLLLERLTQVFRALSQTRIEPSAIAIRHEDARGYWTAKITINGTGDADYIQNRVNTLDAPFEFEWQPGATWPWDWKLVAVRNPALEISDYTP